jgi:release factor glutamine methyltransferase
MALDISEPALAVARDNARRHGVAERIDFRQGDGWAAVPPAARFTLMVANPPYIPSADLAALEPEVRDHDPRLALDGGPDGLEFLRRLAARGREFLRADGCLMAELGEGQSEAVAALFAERGWAVEAIWPDDTARPRILVARAGAA